MHSPWPSITARRGSSAGQIERSRKPSRSAKKATVSSRSGPGSTTWARTVGSAERMPRGYGRDVKQDRGRPVSVPCSLRARRPAGGHPPAPAGPRSGDRGRGGGRARGVRAHGAPGPRGAGHGRRAHLLPAGAQRWLAAGRRRPDRPERADRAGGPGPVPGGRARPRRRPPRSGPRCASSSGPCPSRSAARPRRRRPRSSSTRSDWDQRTVHARPSPPRCSTPCRQAVIDGEQVVLGYVARDRSAEHPGRCTRSAWPPRAPSGTWWRAPRPGCGPSGSIA